MKKLLVFSALCLVLASCSPASFLGGPVQSGLVPNPTQAPTPPGAAQNPSSGTAPSVTALPNFEHIVLIMLENRDYKSALDGTTMPLLTALAQHNVLLSNYFAVAHPSLPNYIALVSGSTQGITSDCTTCFVNQPNLADLVEASGRTWKAYLESMPSPCFVGDANPYAQKHNPLLYFDSIRLDPTRCDRSILPLTSLSTDLANNQLPNFSFIMPNLCNSGHNCPAATADQWASAMVAQLQASPALGKNSLIVVAFDESSGKSNAGCCGLGKKAGGQVAVVLISPLAKSGFVDLTAYSHYSLLKTILTAWKLPSLGHSADAATPLILAPWTGQPDQVGQSPIGNNSAAPAPAAGTGGSSTGGVAGACATSSSTTGGYSVNVCFSDPLSGATLSGNVPVTATVAVTGARTSVQDLVFYLDGSYLLTAYSSPYTFLLRTADWANGSYSLSVEAHMRDKFTSQPGTLPVIFNNGAASNPASTTQFQPTSGITPPNGAPFTVAAGGDGAGGEPTATKVTDLIASLKPDLFLYLGDVYEKGSPAEFFNWYGTTSNFGQFRAITDPTVGNHEYLSPGAAGYFDYWNNIPSYYSFNAGGWHFISLNANLAKLGSAGQSAQYQWLQQDLSANANSCTIVYYHQPLFNIGPEGSATDMTSIWSLLAQYGVSIVLNGHDHDYQRWVPLDGNGQPSPNGITEFVVGSAGHGLQTIANTDSRVAYYNDTPPAAFGVLLLQLSQGSASFTYQSTNGSTLDSGVVPCNHAAPASYVPGFQHGPLAAVPGMAGLAVAWVAAPLAASRRVRNSPFGSIKS